MPKDNWKMLVALEAGGLVFKAVPMLFMAVGLCVTVYSFLEEKDSQGTLLGVAVFGVGYAHLRINRLETQKNPKDGGGE